MNKTMNLVQRNFLVFFRDRAAVFFSLLSMLIVILLMVVFLGNMNVEELAELLRQYGGLRDTAADTERAGRLIELWTIAGILIVNSVTVSFTVTGIMVNDSAANRLNSFLVTPAARLQIMLGYVVSSIIITVCMCMLTLAGSQAFLLARGGTFFTADQIIKAFLYTVLNAGVFSLLMYLLALFVKSPGAWSGLATIIGTLIGFVGAIYLPVGMLPDGVVKILKMTPVLHGASLMRKVFTEDALAAVFAGAPAELSAEYSRQMGIALEIGGKSVSDTFQLCFLGACGIMGIVVVGLIQKNRKFSDR